MNSLIAISNTSPLLFLFRIDAFYLLPALFSKVWVPDSVVDELNEGSKKGYFVPDLSIYSWIEIINPQQIPSEWLCLDLGKGELAAMSLGLENPEHILLLDDRLARRKAQSAGLQVWGTLQVILSAKNTSKITTVKPFIAKLNDCGLWVSKEIINRILLLAGENDEDK